MSVQKFGQWDQALRVLTGLDKKLVLAVQRALTKVGVHVRDAIKKGIRDQAPGGEPFTPLTEFTISRKHSEKALIEHGDLINAITFKLVTTPQGSSWAVFVGLLRSAQGKEGEPLVNIGAVHEYGAVIPVTPKMRGFWGAVFGVHLKPSTTTIVIPARPFLRPVLRAEASKVIEIFNQEISKIFLG